MTTKTATIQDVARRARVSTATVSRALSAPDSVSERKRVAVMEAIESTGYRVNRAARNLRTQRSNTILTLLPTLGNPFFSKVLKGIENILTPAGQSLIVAETQQIQAAGDGLLSYLNDRRADGVIVLDGAIPKQFLDDLEGTPHAAKVVFACEWHERAETPSVRSANKAGARMAMTHLHDFGHQRIAHVTGPAGNVLTDARREAYLAFCEAHELQPILIEGSFSVEAGVAAAATVLNLPTRPSAVFCASDEIAFGLISALTKAGLTVPTDISVLGFDDIEMSEHFLPPLSSVRQDRISLGAEAAQLLLNQIGRGTQSKERDRHVVVPVSLIARDSSGPAP
ncbi:LacI family DNA-binding transcriptional regulator [Gymnodinialimonas sp. 2305UL16-5]|uniref:LacI family DNA-binding transcriptional regulator n=1 Tax=Gymnodinialimonas mytili TaxID=3126503 RepID=UPI0030AEC82D